MGTVLGFDAIGFWIIVTGILVNTSGALLGNFLLLRRMSLLGDAISHAVLPGLAIAFIVTQSRSPIYMLIGAGVAGLLTVLLTESIRRLARVNEDAAIGVVFTSLFALGVVLITRAASQVDLDPGCVLYGILESAALDTTPVFGLDVPRMTLNLGILTAIVLLFVSLLWKELKLVAFDAQLATTLGFRAGLVHVLLMSLVAAFTVIAFEAVGSILVVAMLIVPSATAYLLTDRLGWMALLSVAVGISSAILGREAAYHYNATVAGMMAVMAGGHFALAVLFSPKYGYLAKRIFQLRMGFRIVREDLLALLYRWQEQGSTEPMPRSLIIETMKSGWRSRVAIQFALWQGETMRQATGLRLTDSGTEKASRLIRGHRLWESYLAKNTPLPDDHLHEPAHRMEHFLDEKILSQVEQDVEFPDIDPHGRPLPKDGST